jgi:hypothetical protein
MTTAFQYTPLGFQFDVLAFQIDPCVSGFQADAFQFDEIAFQLCANDITPPVTPVSDRDDGGYWSRFIDESEGSRRKRTAKKKGYRPLGDEFLRVQLEEMRLAGLISENEEEELLVLFIATSMH